MSANVFDLQGSISMDTSGFDKAIKDAVAEGKKLVQALSENTSQMKSLQDSVNQAKAQIDAAEKSMKQAADSASNMSKETNKSSDAVEDMAKEVSGLKSDLAKAEKAVEDTADETKKLADRMDKAEDETKDLKEQVDKLEDQYDKTEKETKELDDDTKKLGNTVEHTSGKFSAFVDFLKNGLVTGLKVGAASIAAAGTAIAGLVTSSVSAYGSYEQLKGGAQKIFEGMDFSKIQDDADNAFKELNMSASEYFEAINLAGASFTQTMGSEKGYETARKGMLAISDFASGTGKSIDELNQKYQMITRSTSSYQSIADQFSGILPQTSKDFLEQAQAAGYLSEQYTKLTDVPVAEYQEAVTNMIEKGVEAQGLLNNTSREASETLTGSLATTKKAWDDLVVAFSDPEADLGKKLDNFVESAEAALTNIVPTVQRAISGIGTAVQKLAPILKTEAPKLISEIVPPLIKSATSLISNLVSALPDMLKALTNEDTVNTILTALTDMITAVTEGLGQIVASAPDIIPGLLEQVGNALVSSVDIIGNAILNMLPDIADLIRQSAPVIFNVLAQLASTVGELFSELAPVLLPGLVQLVSDVLLMLYDSDLVDQMWKLALTVLDSLAEGLIAAEDVLMEVLPEILSGMFDVAERLIEEDGDELGALALSLIGHILELIGGLLGDLLFDLGAKIGEKITNFLMKIGEKLYEFKETVKNKVTDIADSIKTIITGAVNSAKQWGSDLITNFVSGITDNIYKVTDTVSGIASTVKDYIGFSEPDKGALANFHTFAPDMLDLFANGIRENADKVYKEIDSLASGIGTDFNADIAVERSVTPTAAVSGGIVINNTIDMSGVKIASEMDIDDVADGVIEKLSEKLEMLDIYNRIAIGGGIA